MSNGVSVTTRLVYADSTSYGPYAENTWHFSYNPIVTLTAEEAAESGRDFLVEFWTGDAINVAHMTGWLAPTVLGDMEVSWVDWEDTTHTSHPLDPIELTAAGSTAGPNEVASVLTFKCDPYGGHKRQSFYNRVYLGPLTSSALTTPTTVPATIDLSLLEDAVDAYERARGVLDGFGPDTARHAVYSPKHESSGLTTMAWMDNAIDIQRRRGVDATSKTIWPAP